MTDFRMPSLGADMTAGKVVAWHVAAGDTVARGQIIVEVETEKGVFDLEAPTGGTVADVAVAIGTKVPVGTVLAHIAPPGETSALPAPAAAAPAVAPAPAFVAAIRPSGNGAAPQEAARAEPVRVLATPLARRIAQARGIDLSSIAGTGPRGAITKEDIERAVPAPAEVERAGPAPAREVEPAASIAPREAVESAAPAAAVIQTPDDRAAGMRQAIARAVSLSWREIPHYYLTLDVDLAAAMQWLRARNERRSLAERLLPATLLVRAVALALREFPDLNGYWIADELRRSPAVNVALVVARRGGGIVAPALRDAGTLTVDALNAALLDLVQRARTGRLRGSEMTDASITITSLGDEGVRSVHGVIYPPQVALVGFGGISNRPWAVGELLGIRPVVTMTLAADHRATDGHYGSRFLASVARRLQDPEHS